MRACMCGCVCACVCGYVRVCSVCTCLCLHVFVSSSCSCGWVSLQCPVDGTVDGQRTPSQRQVRAVHSPLNQSPYPILQLLFQSFDKKTHWSEQIPVPSQVNINGLCGECWWGRSFAVQCAKRANQPQLSSLDVSATCSACVYVLCPCVCVRARVSVSVSMFMSMSVRTYIIAHQPTFASRTVRHRADQPTFASRRQFNFLGDLVILDFTGCTENHNVTAGHALYYRELPLDLIHETVAQGCGLCPPH